MRNARTTRRRGVTVGLAAALTLLVALVVAGCGGGGSSSSGSRPAPLSEESSGGSSGGAKLSVVGYSTPESVYTEALQPAFEKTPQGKGVSFSDSFGASGDQSRAVAAGQPASVVHFSTGSDMERLVEEGELVSKNWDQTALRRLSRTNSVVVILVEKGNPLGIKSFKDLEENEEAEVITPNPFSSGSARWNIMAVYGSAIEEGASEAEALEAVKKVLEKTDRPAGQRSRRLLRLLAGRGQRAPHLRERSDQGGKRRRRSRIRHPALHDRRSKPRSRSPKKLRSPRPKTSSNSSGRTKARNCGRKTATGRSTRNWSTRKSSRNPKKACSRSPNSAAGAKSRNEFFDEEERLGRQDRGRTRLPDDLRLIDGGPRRK